MTSSTVSEPFPIHQVAGKYLIHDSATVSHIRREYNITGVFIGGLPQAPQQNVFLGLPVELMPEEARLLVEKGAGYIVDDTAQHQSIFLTSNGLLEEEKSRYEALLASTGQGAAAAHSKRAIEKKDAALRRIAEQDPAKAEHIAKVGNGDMDNWNDLPEGMLGVARPRGAGRTKSRQRGTERSVSAGVTPNVSGPPSRTHTPPVGEDVPTVSKAAQPDEQQGTSATNNEHEQNMKAHSSITVADEDESLFGSNPETATLTRQSTSSGRDHSVLSFGYTPSTSYPPLQAKPRTSSLPLTPEATPSYPLFKHLHKAGYFLAPGLRFGCEYMAYPGDPLRYHSHFLVSGKRWDEGFRLVDLVGGGRLGTGVKKGFLLGGLQRRVADPAADGEEEGAEVRAFTIEWAGM